MPGDTQLAVTLHGGDPTAPGRLVLLHGWGADAHDLLDLGEVLMRGMGDVVALGAPEAHPSIPGGRQWYDIDAPGWPGAGAAVDALTARLRALAEERPWKSTAVLGFSQGAAMAMELARALPLAGVVACSGYPHQHLAFAAPPPPLLLIHGDGDAVVPPLASQRLLELAREAGGAVELLRYPAEHTIPTAALGPIRGFLERVLVLTAADPGH